MLSFLFDEGIGPLILRDLLALTTALITAVLFGRRFIKYQIEHQHLEKTTKGDSAELDRLHVTKGKTPTMGGVIFIVAMVVSTLLWARLDHRFIWLLLGVVLVLGTLGFIDDSIKLKRSGRQGLRARMKLALQLLIGAAIGVYLYVAPLTAEPSSAASLVLPFVKTAIPLGLFFIVLVSLVIAGTSNAVNLTDGLDGLAIGCAIIAGIPFAVVAAITGSATISSSLGSISIPGSAEISVFSASLVGAGLGFLWFNRHPAKIFMGDTGALALGGALGLMAILTKKEVFLLLVGGVFVVEALSVILQVASFKLRGKRIFLIAPLHHHFQFKGWEETKVTRRFWLAAAILSLLSMVTLDLW